MRLDIIIDVDHNIIIINRGSKAILTTFDVSSRLSRRIELHIFCVLGVFGMIFLISIGLLVDTLNFSESCFWDKLLALVNDDFLVLNRGEK